MEKKPRNPVWSRDELILALDLYVRTNGNPTGQDFEALDELSATLNKLHRITGNATGATLRNRNGVYLKVMNFRSSDPHYLEQGKVGMTRGNKLEGVLWQQYANDPVGLAKDAQVIRATILAADDTTLSQHPLEPPYEGEEGGVVLAMHKRYERDRKLVREKLKLAKAAGPLQCEVCAFNFEASYGALGAGYVEVHHTKPVHTLVPGTKTKLTDLVLLCANCHRMAHRSMMLVPIGMLKSIISTKGNH